MRVYIDTSVVGGRFDPEFERRTVPFWESVQNGNLRLIVSDLLEEELARVPKQVQDFLRSMPENQIENISATEESDSLAQKYITAGVVGKTSLGDCRHIALATLARADVLVSLNFRHIVNIRRIQGYNGVNLLHGYPTIEIRTPDEVINDEI